MSERNFTFFLTSSRPGSGEYSSAGESRSRARLVENPTWAITTERSGWAARVLRSTAVALGAAPSRKQVVGKAVTIAVFFLDQRQISALFDDASFANNTDRNIGRGRKTC